MRSNLSPKKLAFYRAAAFVLRIVLGGILLYAAITKWREGPLPFATSMANYRIGLIPAILVPALSVSLLGVETLVGLALIAGVWKKQAAFLASFLFAMFSAAVFSALLRDVNITCGCFGVDSDQISYKVLFLHDLVPFSLSIILLLLVYKIDRGQHSG